MAGDEMEGIEEELGALLDGPPEAETDAEAIDREYSRDEGGRFAAKQAEDDAKAAAAVQAATKAPGEPWKPVWYKDEFGDFKQMPEPFRNALKAREDEFGRKWQEQAAPANAWRGLEAKIQPYMQELSAAGVQPAQYFENLHNANEYLRKDPEAALQWLAQSSGVDLVALADKIYAAQGGEAAPGAPGADPLVAQLQQQIAGLEQKLGGVTKFQHDSMEQQRQAQFNSRLAEIEDFAKDKPQFDALEGTMVNLMRGGQAKTLQEAYEQAQWLHPEVRERILTEQRKANVTKARAASASPRGAASNGRAVSKPTMSVEEELGMLIDGL